MKKVNISDYVRIRYFVTYVWERTVIHLRNGQTLIGFFDRNWFGSELNEKNCWNFFDFKLQKLITVDGCNFHSIEHRYLNENNIFETVECVY